MKTQKIVLKVNKEFGSHKVGDKITIDAINGIPTNEYYRNRLKDAKIDNCCEIYKQEEIKNSSVKNSKSTKKEANK